MDEQSPLTEAERPAKIGHTAWVLLIILPFVIFTRLWGLGQKPFHHDESLFASYAYHLRVTGDYDFNEILHGPFLEDVSALIFAIFGDSEVTARLWPAVAGSLLVLLVWRLRDLLGNLAALLGVVFLTASPTLMYYSRFNRNDVPFTFAAMLFVYCVARFFQRGRMWQWLLALMAVGWMICIEETYVIFLFTVATYAVALGLVEAAAGTPSSRRAAWARLSSSQPGFARKFALTTVLGLLAALLMIVTLYTTFFKHLEHADGPIEAIIYWAGQHREQRIFGEFHYYVPILLIYEFLFVAIFIWGVGRTLRRAAWLRGWIGWAWATWSVVLLAALWKHRIPDGLAAILHMQRGWHLWLAIEIFVLGAATCAVLVTERRLLDGFFVWWTVIAFLAYSYAGEKVPWIAVHVVFPMIVTAAIFVQEIARSAAISEVPRGRLLTRAALRGFARTPALAFFVVALPATTAIALRLSFVNDANPAERHVYTHTTDDYKAMIEEVVDIASASGQPPISFPVLVQGSSIWPGQWYFRRLRTIAVEGPMPPDAAIRQLPVLVLDEYLDDPAARKGSATLRYPWLLSDYVVRRVPFREWWRQEKLLETTARLADIWMALVPAQYRAVVPLTDSTGRPTGWIGDRDRLPNMTVEEEIRASKAVWRAVCDYLVYRRDFDPYRAAYPSRDHQSVLLCVKKDLHKKWLTQGGRHLPARTRFVRGPQ